MRLNSVRPIGTFHVRVTKDAAAHRRDGELVYAMNDLGPHDVGERLLEVLFGDGVWMLATPMDLDPATPISVTS